MLGAFHNKYNCIAMSLENYNTVQTILDSMYVARKKKTCRLVFTSFLASILSDGFSWGLCSNLCFLALPASQTTPQPAIAPSAVATRKPMGEEAGLSSSQCDGVDKHCSSEYMQNTTANNRDCQGLCSLCGSS